MKYCKKSKKPLWQVINEIVEKIKEETIWVTEQ